MPAPAIHLASAASNAHRALVLRDTAAVAGLMACRWGEPLAPGWQPLELAAAPGTQQRALADVSALYLPGLLVLTEGALAALSQPPDLADAADPARAPTLPWAEVERLPLRLAGQTLFLLNPLATVRRFKEDGARFMRMPGSGALLFLEAADFHAEDLPAQAPIFWFHDGNAARYLLCRDAFVGCARAARLSGLGFTRLGHVLPQDAV